MTKTSSGITVNKIVPYPMWCHYTVYDTIQLSKDLITHFCNIPQTMENIGYPLIIVRAQWFDVRDTVEIVLYTINCCYWFWIETAH